MYTHNTVQCVYIGSVYRVKHTSAPLWGGEFSSGISGEVHDMKRVYCLWFHFNVYYLNCCLELTKAQVANPAMCTSKCTRGNSPHSLSFSPALREELDKVQRELSGSKEKAAILIEMYKQNESRIEELVMENAKLKSQLSAVDRTSQSYDVREDICTHIYRQTQYSQHRLPFSIIIHVYNDCVYYIYYTKPV